MVKHTQTIRQQSNSCDMIRQITSKYESISTKTWLDSSWKLFQNIYLKIYILKYILKNLQCSKCEVEIDCPWNWLDSHPWFINSLINFADNPNKDAPIDSFHKRITHIHRLIRANWRHDNFTTCKRRAIR